nr:IclR family transcriptional regulator C-terminal domain-containing protein [Nocardioides ochotonae]
MVEAKLSRHLLGSTGWNIVVVVSEERVGRTGVGERLLEVLEAFVESGDRLTLDQVRETTGLPRTTTYRMLRLLSDRSWLDHGPSGYALGPQIASLGRRAGDLEELRSAASGPLNELQGATGAVAHLSVLDGASIRHVDKVGGASWADVPSSIGMRLPVHDTASGWSILAAMRPEEADAVLALRFHAGVPATLTELHRELHAARRNRGVAVRTGDHRAARVTTVAAPVIGPHGPVAAIMLGWRRQGPTTSRAIELVAAAARRTSQALHPEAGDG